MLANSVPLTFSADSLRQLVNALLGKLVIIHRSNAGLHFRQVLLPGDRHDGDGIASGFSQPYTLKGNVGFLGPIFLMYYLYFA